MAIVDEILSAREKTHGDFEVGSYLSQTLKDFMREAPNWPKLDMDQKECLDMVAHKIARILCGNPNEADHFLDGAGYFTLVANRLMAAEL